MRVIPWVFPTNLELLVDCSDLKQGLVALIIETQLAAFFEDFKMSVSVTEVDKDLIIRIHRIFQAVSRDHEINPNKFQKYILQRTRKLVQL